MDPENGTVATEEVSSTVEEPSQLSQETQETPESQETPQLSNSVGDALDAFNKELGRSSTAAVAEKPTPSQQQQHKARVFDGLDPQEVDYFKRMSNQAYDALYPQWIEAKKLKAEREQLQKDLEEAKKLHFYEHDGAYKLLPEYNELSQANEQIAAEINHWQEQLALIEAGQPWTPLVKDAQGNVVYGAEREPTPQDKAKVLNALSQGHVISSNIRNKIAEFEGNFKQQHSGYLKQLSDTRAKIFQGADLNKLAKAAESKLDMFPTSVRGKPEVKMLAEGMVIIEGLLQMINDLKSSKVSAVAKARTSSNNGPKEAAAGAAVANKTAGSAMEEFRKAGFNH